MYLSRLILNPRSKAAKRDLADCHEAHRTVLSVFPDLNEVNASAREHFGVLYRMDLNPKTGAITILVQSVEKPDWSKLPEGYLLADTNMQNPACKPVEELYDNIKEGMILNFRLRSNPTKKVGTSKKKDIEAGKPKSNGHRIPIGDEQGQVEWLKRKGANGGFELITVRLSPQIYDVQTIGENLVKGEVSHGTKMTGKDGFDILSFGSVLFEGRLKVTDKEKFLDVLKSGIGTGKAYGFGLISIARSG